MRIISALGIFSAAARRRVSGGVFSGDFHFSFGGFGDELIEGVDFVLQQDDIPGGEIAYYAIDFVISDLAVGAGEEDDGVLAVLCELNQAVAGWVLPVDLDHGSIYVKFVEYIFQEDTVGADFAGHECICACSGEGGGLISAFAAGVYRSFI